jgi:hydrogenase nickel incorporation protein HypA/HybF
VHELALLGSVVKAVEDACSTADASVVKAAEASLVKAAETSVVKTVETSVVKVVALRVGAMCGAVPAALEWAWPLAVAGSVAEGAELLLEEVPAAVWCPACDAEREIDTFYALRCPVCGQPTADLVRGREFLVSYVELDVPDDHG